MKNRYPLHEELASLARMKPPIYRPLLPLMSAVMVKMFPCKSDETVLVKRYEVAGYEGSMIPVYVMEPREAGEEPLPCLVFFHGGGFIFRASGAHYQIAKEYALRLSCKVVYADYRLAPKHPFPVPVEDCYAVYQWVLEQAKILVNSKLNTLTKLAKEEQILSYARLYGAKEIKEFLYQSKSPIPFVISTYNGIDLDMNKIMLPNAIMNETGNHMMLIIGWNEEGFIIQNSWGKDWGDQGLAILPYEYPIEEAWGVTLDPEQKIIVKPQFYWIRKIIQFIINLFINGLK